MSAAWSYVLSCRLPTLLKMCAKAEPDSEGEYRRLEAVWASRMAKLNKEVTAGRLAVGLSCEEVVKLDREEFAHATPAERKQGCSNARAWVLAVPAEK